MIHTKLDVILSNEDRIGFGSDTFYLATTSSFKDYTLFQKVEDEIYRDRLTSRPHKDANMKNKAKSFTWFFENQLIQDILMSQK